MKNYNIRIDHTIDEKKDSIFLIDSKSDLDKSLFDECEKLFFDKRLKKEDSYIFCHHNGITKVVYWMPNGDDKNRWKEKIRQAAHAILKCDDWNHSSEIQLITASSSHKKSWYYFMEGALLSNYCFSKYKTAKIEECLCDIVVTEKDALNSDLDELLAISKAVYKARDLVNEPLSFLTATQLSEEFKSMGTDANIKVEVLEKAQIKKLGMGGLLGVNQGSIDPPTFTIMTYRPENAVNTNPYVFVGKGVVYDTGGLSLKPTPSSMDYMKSDMAGAAVVASALYAAALAKLPIYAISIIPATDNRPSQNAYAPGDVLNMYNGKTVEVLNTDAEGRLILADALSYSERYEPELVIDAATLTGAAAVAIGTLGIVAMGNASDAQFKELKKCGDAVHERIAQFPFWEEYGDMLKSEIADMKNLGGREGGAITAGKFLENFVTDPWIHLDIAGPSFLHKPEGYRPIGGTGVGVRLLYHFLKKKCL